MAVEITREDMSADDLRAASAQTKDAKAARRMLAIALVLEGSDRKAAAETCGMADAALTCSARSRRVSVSRCMSGLWASNW